MKHTLFLILLLSVSHKLHAMNTLPAWLSQGTPLFEATPYPLHEAVKHGRTDWVCGLLTHHNADINEANGSGKTALHDAAHNSQFSLCQLLLEKGADPFARDWNNLLPLADIRSPELVRLFLTTGPSLVPMVTTIMAMNKFRPKSVWHSIPKDVIRKHIMPFLIAHAVEKQLEVAKNLLEARQPYNISMHAPPGTIDGVLYCSFRQMGLQNGFSDEQLKRVTSCHVATCYRRIIKDNIHHQLFATGASIEDL